METLRDILEDSYKNLSKIYEERIEQLKEINAPSIIINHSKAIVDNIEKGLKDGVEHIKWHGRKKYGFLLDKPIIHKENVKYHDFKYGKLDAIAFRVEDEDKRQGYIYIPKIDTVTYHVF